MKTALLTVMLVIAPRVAQACLNIPCSEVSLSVGPANIDALVLVDRTSPTPQLALRDAAGKAIAVSIAPEGHVPGVFLVRPAVPLVADAVFDATHANCVRPDTRVVVCPAAELPRAIGELAVSSSREGPGESGCIQMPTRVRTVELRLQRDPLFDKYAAVASSEWLVDGAPYASPYPISIAGPNPESATFYADCSNTNRAYLSPGAHQIGVRAWIPGQPALITTKAVSFDCADDGAAGEGGCAYGGHPQTGITWIGLVMLGVWALRHRPLRDR